MASADPPPPPKATAGWYPDPAGTASQRYFDGTDWTSKFSWPTKPPKKGMSGKAVLAIVGGILVLIVIGRSCGGSDDKKDSSSTSSSSAAAAAPATPAGPKKPDATFTTAQGADGDVVTVRFAIKDNLTKGFIKDGARFDTIEILKYAQATYPNASQVNVQGTFPMKDQYGNTSTDVVINITYLRSTLDKINFDGVSKDQIWEIRDFGFIAPAFQP
jgi:Protein of unknown function (DUF2510)